jgi:hypothetical protein
MWAFAAQHDPLSLLISISYMNKKKNCQFATKRAVNRGQCHSSLVYTVGRVHIRVSRNRFWQDRIADRILQKILSCSSPAGKIAGISRNTGFFGNEQFIAGKTRNLSQFMVVISYPKDLRWLLFPSHQSIFAQNCVEDGQHNWPMVYVNASRKPRGQWTLDDA